ncbi:MAG: prepilin-type N-terminal cleavage/methylation domain-containing protein [Candidatus Omnitrophica bacterium]|nr:prepilin-type N-terminal cleavage/methylation domain-containing protein [Candidatus Omnitrophota bacterium]MDD5512245.1 prepilin-type N-terminal cleavage/methylation domain-containing protein [Candidatus Omnitrophota bacterium]
MKKGFTFIELMVSAAVVLVIVVAVFQVYFSTMSMVTLSREIGVATDDLKDVVESIKAAPFSNLQALFPAGAPVNPASIGIGALVLDNESIVVTYPAYSGPYGANPDLLLVRVTVTWTGRDRRGYTQSFDILRSRGLS